MGTWGRVGLSAWWPRGWGQGAEGASGWEVCVRECERLAMCVTSTTPSLPRILVVGGPEPGAYCLSILSVHITPRAPSSL